MKKRVISFLMAIVLMTTVVSCGKKDSGTVSDGTASGNNTAAQDNTKTQGATGAQGNEQVLINEGEDTETKVEYRDYEGENSSMFLEKGEKIAVISPSALPSREQTDSTIQGLKDWGYEPVEGKHVCDETRSLDDVMEDLTWALEDPEIKAIFCVRGGYGASEVADALPKEKIKDAQKLIIGYSDITVYHSAWTTAGIPSIHSCMSGTFNGLPDSCFEATEKILEGEMPSYTCEKDELGIEGTAKGVLIGGNLATLTAVLDSAYDCTRTGKPYILFLEDVGENVQHIHRYLTVLKHNGVLDNAAGIVFGEWAELPTDLGDYSGSSRGGKFESVADMITRQFLTDINVPVAFGFPAGHGDINYPLLMGEMAELNVNADNFTLTCGVQDDVERLLGQWTLDEKIEQMMLVSFRKMEDTSAENGEEASTEAINVTSVNQTMAEYFKQYGYGGVLLFGENFVDAEQTMNLISDMQAASRLPLFIAVDQEGGSVARVSFGTTGVGNMALAATGDPENAGKMAGIYGKELALLGINMDFAPVVDINNNPNNPVIGVRSFSDSPEVVSEYAVSYMKGLHENGVISSLKHFPGHGNTDTDSHTGFPRIDLSLDQLKENELIPFKSAIDAGADMVITAHIQYPEIETQTYTSISTGEEVYIPATMSHRILTDILKGEMGFKGVIVTDALDMKAISDNFAPEDVMLMTINAGADLIMLPPIHNMAEFEQVHEMIETAKRLAKEGKISEDTIDDSVRRILTLKQKYGLLGDYADNASEERLATAKAGVGSSENRQVAWDMAEKALTLLKNENDAFPVKISEGESTLILFSDSCASRIGTGELVKQMLKEQEVYGDDSQIVVMKNDAENAAACIDAAKAADHCILVHRMYQKENLDPTNEEGISSGVFDNIIDSLHEDGKKVILISCQLPYDAARFTDADAILLSYNSGAMTQIPPESGAGSAYAPNLAVALMACFGDGNVTGTLPVNLPELDDSYGFTENILYKSGN